MFTTLEKVFFLNNTIAKNNIENRLAIYRSLRIKRYQALNQTACLLACLSVCGASNIKISLF